MLGGIKDMQRTWHLLALSILRSRTKPTNNNLSFKKLYKPTNNNLRTSSNSRNKTEDTTPRYNNDNQSGQFGNQRTMTVVGARETVGSPVVQQNGIQCFNCKGFGHYARECRKPKRVKDYAYHKEKMMMCKQAEQGVPLQAEQADWLEDTDEEIDEQELEAHYSYMAKIQEVSPEESSSTSQPLEQVQNHDENDVFANVRRHSEQPESINDTYVLEKDDSNVIPDSSNICTNDNQVDQNATECVDERAALANLIANLTLDNEENKTFLKQLKKANASLTQELKECKTNLDESSRALGEATSSRDSSLIALQTKQTELEKYTALNDLTSEYKILQTKLNDTLGLLAKDIDIKEGLKTKTYEISVVNQKHDELVKKSLLTRSQFEGQLKEKSKVISDLKVKEGKDIDTMIEMDKQIKFLNEILYKRNQSIQTIHMLAPKCATYHGRSTFANPKYLKKAQSDKPRLYEIPYDTSDPANRFCPNGEETVTLEKESRSKLDKDTVKPYNYTYQNSLYETFKPPSKTYLDQLERAKEVRKTMWRKTFVRTKPNIAKNVGFLPMSKSISKSRLLYNEMTNNFNHFRTICQQTWSNHTSSAFPNPTAKSMEVLIKILLMPLSDKTILDSHCFVHELKREMNDDLEYVNSLEKELDELESEKADFSNIYDLLLEECVSKDVTCSYLHSMSHLNANTELQCMYLHKVKECECLALKLSKQTESVNKEVHNNLLKSFSKLEKHSISLELSLQHCKEQMKNNPVCKENASNVFRKEREQYHEIQDLKAQMQDKNMVINELKKLILVTKGKSVETQFDKPSVVRQPNAQRIPKPSVLGKPTPFSNSPEMRSFQTKQSVNKTNVSDGLFKPVTQQSLPQNRNQAVRNTNVLKPGMFRIASTTTQTRTPQLPHASRNTNPHMSKSSGVIHTTSVSRPQLKSYQVKEKVVPNISQVKFTKKEVEDHHRISSISKKTKSVTACNDSSNSRTSNVNAVCAECGKCVFNSNHDACVSRYLKDVNARTKKPLCSAICAKIHKRKSDQICVCTPPIKKTVASDTTIQKSKELYKEIVQLILFIVDSGCTKHMTGNLKLLCNFVEKFLGTVHFGNDQFAPILGYGDLIQGNVTIKRVYYVEGLNHNLFSVGQFCDADLEVAFRKSTCFVRDLQGNDLLTGSRGSDLYTISLQETTSSTPICFMAKASPTQAWLWHRRLSHLNFDYITFLSKKEVVNGLPKLKYVKDQLCSSCEMSKAKRSSFKTKAVPSSKGRLNLLHMDLCGPMRVASINGKKPRSHGQMASNYDTLTPFAPKDKNIVLQQKRQILYNKELEFIFRMNLSVRQTTKSLGTSQRTKNHLQLIIKLSGYGKRTRRLKIRTVHSQQSTTVAKGYAQERGFCDFENHYPQLLAWSRLQDPPSPKRVFLSNQAKYALENSEKKHNMDNLKIGSTHVLESSSPGLSASRMLWCTLSATTTLKHLIRGLKESLNTLKGTLNMGLVSKGFWALKLTAFSDAEFHAGCLDTHEKATSGGDTVSLVDKLVSWMSKKQYCTANVFSRGRVTWRYLQVVLKLMGMRTPSFKDYGFN
ncbi:retrovirus-related pol polyprotein from transposon TNT 1-94 [Tanacetum coccineum]|uniref:Retrovirus-related pol polyprotein from transposon TNT 1-94 n=2 Tax=Tanacetum coccineum TaxID=301880 RepID=A0ABQ5F7N7_9ASTR